MAAKKSVKEQVQDKFKEFAAECEGLSVDGLKARIVSYQQQLQESEEAKAGDVELENARNTAAEYAAPYNDVKKAVKLKTSYLIELIAEKGG